MNVRDIFRSSRSLIPHIEVSTSEGASDLSESEIKRIAYDSNYIWCPAWPGWARYEGLIPERLKEGF